MNAARVQSIIAEERAAGKQYAQDNFGARNGEEFVELAKAAAATEEVKSALEISALKVLMFIVMGDLSRLRPKREEIAREIGIESALLDFLWMGYRLGRRMQREEDEAIAQMEKENRA